MMKNIAILGSTGSIGTQTLDIVRYNQDVRVTALAAGGNVCLMERQIREFKPRLACLWDEEKAKEILSTRDNEQIQNVAQLVGCGNTPYYFSKIFKKCTGLTPSAYVKKMSK